MRMCFWDETIPVTARDVNSSGVGLTFALLHSSQQAAKGSHIGRLKVHDLVTESLSSYIFP